MFRKFAAMLAVVVLGACTNPNDLEEEPTYLGNFTLAHNVVVAPNITKGPASREASEEEWIAEMKAAVDERFRRYDGGKLYHLGISIEGYVLAIPGVPIVASPKSALILNVTAWDDASQTKLNEKPELITVVESFSGKTILGSGLTQSKEVQMFNLTRNASKQIENWLVNQNNQQGWFEADGRPAKEKLTLLGNRVEPESEEEGGAESDAVEAPLADEAEGATDEAAANTAETPSSDAAAAAAAAATIIEEPEVSAPDDDS